MTKRLKATSFTTRAEFDSALDTIAGLQVDLRAAEAYRDTEIQAVRDMHEPACVKISVEIQSTVVLAEKYALEHRAELFPTARKSGDTSLANYGFRLGNPTLKLTGKKWSWESVLAAVKAAFPKRFVRTTEEVDKEALKAQLTSEQLASVGCRVSQSETFYVEAKEQPAKATA